MAARLTARQQREGRRAAVRALWLLLVGLLAACGAGGQATRNSPLAATPAASLSSAIAAAEARLAASLAAEGFRLEAATSPYRPGEPEALQGIPRAVYRVSLADPDGGWVVIYDPAAGPDVQVLGREFATYLGSGLGQTNYPRGARFALSEVGGALVFSWWSPERAADAEQAQAAFEAVRSVGRPFEIRR